MAEIDRILERFPDDPKRPARDNMYAAWAVRAAIIEAASSSEIERLREFVKLVGECDCPNTGTGCVRGCAEQPIQCELCIAFSKTNT